MVSCCVWCMSLLWALHRIYNILLFIGEIFDAWFPESNCKRFALEVWERPGRIQMITIHTHILFADICVRCIPVRSCIHSIVWLIWKCIIPDVRNLTGILYMLLPYACRYRFRFWIDIKMMWKKGNELQVYQCTCYEK